VLSPALAAVGRLTVNCPKKIAADGLPRRCRLGERGPIAIVPNP